jgi:hypothetical protein
MNRQAESDKGFSEDVMFAFQVIFFVKNIQDSIPFRDPLRLCSIYLLDRVITMVSIKHSQNLPANK